MAKQKPLAALKWNDALTKAAEFHNADTGPKGLKQHSSSDGTSFYARVERLSGFFITAENLDWVEFTKDKGKRHLLRFVIDDGVPSRGHRTNIYNPMFTDVGIALGPHAVTGQMLTMDFGFDFGSL